MQKSEAVCTEFGNQRDKTAMEEKHYFVGIDIGSTASKTVILEGERVKAYFTLPTGWNGREASQAVWQRLTELGVAEQMKCVATGYGRVCVEFADRVVTEITCHGKGGWAIFGQNGTIIDVGGQDTKIITVENGQVSDFLMNDKCAAGTGKFVEVMATRLGASLEEFYQLAQQGTPLSISAMCTVFAESEVISHIGNGEKREDIAAGVVDSVVSRVANLCIRHGRAGQIFLTGGLCDSPYFVQTLSQKLSTQVETHPFARYAGALGAALTAGKLTNLSALPEA
jgi:predicted CoA-substrate-specific enzyme activase